MSPILRSWTGAAAVVAAALLGGCATHAHGPHDMQAAGPGMSCPMHAQMQQQMQQQMAAAKTPEERQALMAEHHKGMGGMGGMACPIMQPAPK